MATSGKDSESTGFPSLFSDEEIDALHEQRERAARARLGSNDLSDDRLPPTPNDGRPESIIEQRFPHVAKMLVAMWPSEAFALYVKRIVVADRASRAGFPRDVVDDLLMLDEINDKLLRKVTSREAGPIYTAMDHGLRKP